MLKRLLLVGLASIVTVAPLVAQRANRRDGFWIGFGVGSGSTGADCYRCVDSRTEGLSGYFRAGGTLTRNVQLGGEVNSWVNSVNGVDEMLHVVSIVGLWYPNTTRGFFLKFGAGVTGYRADYGVDEVSATAPAASFGLGYDFPMNRQLSLTPYFNLVGTGDADFRLNGERARGRDISLNLVQLGLGFTWQ